MPFGSNVLLSAGMFGGIYGVNGRFLEIKDLTSVFKAVQCPSLAGKPKLFFLQACQGKSKQRGIIISSSGSLQKPHDQANFGAMPEMWATMRENSEMNDSKCVSYTCFPRSRDPKLRG